MKINIVMAGRPCSGKSTLAARLFAQLKEDGYDYDLIFEEDRKLRREFGEYRNPFETVPEAAAKREQIRSTIL